MEGMEASPQALWIAGARKRVRSPGSIAGSGDAGWGPFLTQLRK